MRTSVWTAVFLALLMSVTAVASTLRVSVPPLFGSVPVILASEDGWGLFAEEGLDVTLVPLPSQSARLQAFRARQLDVMIADLTLALMLVSERGADAVIAGATYSAHGLDEDAYPPVVLITPQRFSRIYSLEQLAREASARRVNIAVARQSDLEFMLDQLLHAEGLVLPEGTYVGRDDLLENADYLAWGRVHAAALPQPYAEYLLSIDLPHDPQFLVLSEFNGITVPPTVVVMRRSIVEEDPAEVAAFFRSLDRAVERVNSLPREELLELGWQLVTQLFLPGQEPHTMSPEDRERVEEALETLFIPDFPMPDSLSEGPFHEVLSWARSRGYVRSPVEFDEVVVSPVR